MNELESEFARHLARLLFIVLETKMQVAPLPNNEVDRLTALRALAVLDTPSEPELDTLVKIASEVCGTPISLLTLVDEKRLFLKANNGLPGVTETSRDVAFCAYTILGTDLLEVPDAHADPRFRDNPLVAGDPHIRFYAAIPIRLHNDVNIGSLCVIDRIPRQLSPLQREVLQSLAKVAIQMLEGRRALIGQHDMARSLRESEQLFRALAESSPIGIYHIDDDSNRIYVNPRWLEIWGLSRDEALSATWRKHIHPDDFEAANASLQKSLDQREDFDVRYRIIRPDGSLRHVHSLARPIISETGASLGFIGSIEDVTDQVNMLERLASNEARIRRIYEATPAMIYALDNDYNLAIVSDLWLSRLGYAREDVIGRQMPEFMPKLSGSEVALRARKQFEEIGVVENIDLQMTRKSGEIIDVRMSVIAEDRLQSGSTRRAVGVLQDVTEQHRAESALKQALERMRIATDSGRIGIWDWDLKTGAVIWDDWTRRIYGELPDHQPLTFEAFSRFVHPDDRDALAKATREAIEDEVPLDTEFRITWDDGSIHHIRATGLVSRDADGVAVRLVGANWDVTEQRRLSSALIEQHELLRVTMQSIGDAVISTDKNGIINWINPVAERMTGWPAKDAVGAPLPKVFNIIHEDTREPCQDPVALCLATGNVIGLANKTVLIARDGTEYGIADSAAPIRGSDGHVLGVVLVFHDVTEQRRLSSEMSYRASHDALTGLVNRSEFEARLRRALVRAQEQSCEHSLVYLDLDQFKVVNDSCGHAVGDVLLKQVAKLFRTIVRDSDTVGRLGGDEFAFLLEFCTPEQAIRVAQTVCDRMNEFRFVHDGRRFRVGTSIGVVPVDGRWSSIAAIQQAADSACYAAKEGGRNRVHIWSDKDQVSRSHRTEMHWSIRIDQALDDDGFELFAQRIEPIAGALEGVSAEVLVRMRGADGEVILPGVFLPAAERFHLASRIDRWVLGAVIDWMQEHRNLGSLDRLQSLSINLSGQTIGDRTCHRQIVDQLILAGPSIVGKLCIEITETDAITNMVDAVLFVEQLRDIGVKVALDDFGAASSSFGYLKKLKVDLLKIDRQFIQDLVEEPLDEVAVRCFVDVARVAGAATVAKCVETEPVLNRLKDLAIDFAQGYVLHAPTPISKLL